MQQAVGQSGHPETASIWKPVHRFLLRYGAYIALVLVFGYFSLNSPIFLTPFNLLNVLRQVAVLAVASFGMASVVMGGGTDVIAGGIDLSIAAILALVTAICATLLLTELPVPVVLLVALLVALVIEAINAAMVVYLGMLPLLATLAMMFTINGLELVFTQNTVIAADVPFVRGVAEGQVLGIPMMVVILFAVCAVYYLFLHQTPAGTHIQAVGGNPEAAHTSGLPVRFYTILSYLLAGLAATISGVLVLARLSGSTPGISSVMLLDIVLATYVSATFSPRWTVNIPGCLLGAILVGVLTNGFTLINVPTFWVHGIKGVLVLFVVSATSLQQKGASA
jgi:ribose transport system permease protein